MPKEQSPAAQTEKKPSVHPLVELHEAHHQANWNWAQEVQTAIAESQAQCQKDQVAFVKNLQDQWRSATDYNQYVEGFRNQLKQLQERSANDDLNKRLLEAHRNYLRAIREAWSRLDPDSITFG